jgi:predicted Rossmann fold flavoprotein
LSRLRELVAVHVDHYSFSRLAGISIKGSSVDFFHSGEDKKYKTAIGDLLFTHKGISGPVILNNSRDIKKNDLLLVSLIPTENKEKSRIELLSSLTNEPKKQIKNVLKSFSAVTSLSESILSEINIDRDEKCSVLKKNSRNKLITMILDYPFVISRKGYFSSAMITVGGIDLDEVNRKTMESKLVKNLYFAGEVLDIDGDSGGYNIQAAFSTAYLIASTLL